MPSNTIGPIMTPSNLLFSDLKSWVLLDLDPELVLSNEVELDGKERRTHFAKMK